ncbi:MAG: toll/interleukin-1 receptor domain-containing protein [Propionibacteriaceae bacterium]|nr:toll/interleukin-1 receptor domain-containing protein [Propionibacteriaceae bacterium]
MSTNSLDTRPYSVFVSYSRRDDVGGWVTALVDALRREYERSGDRGFRIFFDHSDIRSRQDWESQLRFALRQARVMLVCVSMEYFRSQPCLWEFLEHEGKATRPEDAFGLVPVFLEDTKLEDPDDVHARWHARVYRMHGRLDIRAMFSREPESVTAEELAGLVAQLADDLHEQQGEVRRREETPSNVGAGTPLFVGRHEELDRLDEVLASHRSVGVVTAVRGLGGIGKTELVRRYSHVHKLRFSAGTWLLPAEGAREMLPLLARLAPDLPDFALPEEARGNPEEAGRCVRAELLRRTSGGDGVLLILDNVDQAALLGIDQLRELPEGREIYVAATTRLGHKELPELDRLAHVPIGGLKRWEAVALLRAFQPGRGADGQPDFASSDDEAAAGELADLLGGFTLAVEQAGAYLKTHPDMSVREYLEHLRTFGALSADTMLKEQEKAHISHERKLLGVILDETMASLEASYPGIVEVLRLAAAMPADLIPWSWLEELAREVVPGVFEVSRQFPKGRWMRIRRVLEGRGLIGEGKYPGETGRMHRLIAEHLNQGRGEMLELVDRYVVGRAGKVFLDSTVAARVSEVDGLLDGLQRPLSNRPEQFEEAAGFFQSVASAYATDSRAVGLVEGVLESAAGQEPGLRALGAMVLGDLVMGVDPGRALGLVEEGLEIHRGLVEAQPESLEALRALSVSLNNAGVVVQSVDPGRALGLFEEGLEICRGLVEAQPGNLDVLSGLAGSLGNVGGLVRGVDPGRALMLAEEGLEICRGLVEAQPGNLHVLQGLAGSLGRVGGLAEGVDPGRALGLFEEGLVIRRGLVAAEPGNLHVLRDLAGSLGRVGGLVRGVDPGRALGLFEEGLGICRGLVEALPGNLHVLQMLAGLLRKSWTCPAYAA